MLQEIIKMLRTDPLDFAWHVCESLVFAACLWACCVGLAMMAGTR